MPSTEYVMTMLGAGDGGGAVKLPDPKSPLVCSCKSRAAIAIVQSNLAERMSAKRFAPRVMLVVCGLWSITYRDWLVTREI